jgi:hypothetical protein
MPSIIEAIRLLSCRREMCVLLEHLSSLNMRVALFSLRSVVKPGRLSAGC